MVCFVRRAERAFDFGEETWFRRTCSVPRRSLRRLRTIDQYSFCPKRRRTDCRNLLHRNDRLNFQNADEHPGIQSLQLIAQLHSPRIPIPRTQMRSPRSDRHRPHRQSRRIHRLLRLGVRRRRWRGSGKNGALWTRRESGERCGRKWSRIFRLLNLSNRTDGWRGRGGIDGAHPFREIRARTLPLRATIVVIDARIRRRTVHERSNGVKSSTDDERRASRSPLR